MAHDPSGDLDELRVLARGRQAETARFLEFLRWRLDWPDRKLDVVVRGLSREVAAQVDCRDCAQCCRTLGFDVSDADVDRLAAGLGLDVSAVHSRYFPGDAPGRRAIRPPCPFLSGNSCSVYANRPDVCRDYPHLEKGKIRHRTNTLLDNTFCCPIVFRALERLEQRLGFPVHGAHRGDQ